MLLAACRQHAVGHAASLATLLAAAAPHAWRALAGAASGEPSVGPAVAASAPKWSLSQQLRSLRTGCPSWDSTAGGTGSAAATASSAATAPSAAADPTAPPASVVAPLATPAAAAAASGAAAPSAAADTLYSLRQVRRGQLTGVTRTRSPPMGALPYDSCRMDMGPSHARQSHAAAFMHAACSMVWGARCMWAGQPPWWPCMLQACVLQHLGTCPSSPPVQVSKHASDDSCWIVVDGKVRCMC